MGYRRRPSPGERDRALPRSPMGDGTLRETLACQSSASRGREPLTHFGRCERG